MLNRLDFIAIGGVFGLEIARGFVTASAIVFPAVANLNLAASLWVSEDFNRLKKCSVLWLS